MHNSLTEFDGSHGAHLQFFSLFFPICLLKKGPQDLPWSPALLLKACLLQWFSSALLFLLLAPAATAFFRASIAIALSLSVWSLVLWLSNRGERLLQVLTAVQGCATLLNIGMWPLMFLMSTVSSNPAMALVLNVAMIVWSMSIHAHILRHALNWRYAFALTLAIALFLIRVSLFQQITSPV
ncbi:hypothetical protein [Permianibacter aggregans]|uniref:Yip1-like protein n=1 Tax=Permianibacter aggregans TaxID=1510150 RepID=A0A4R6UNH9_9GAMM|nr:hypothetical protein [Permianibacter aggregans]QGX40820.1 hypothetical protein E2H98_14590 [Permianibacter aggregans]TDQ48362.1 hypothetical protein EV696_10798 [Permianibacter aggregans]